MNKIGMAVIGCGTWGDAHAEIYASEPDTKLVAVCDHDEARVKSLAEKYGCRHFTNYRDMLRNDEIKAVGVVTPDFAHADPVVAAAEAGKHVLVEKPLATTWEDVRRIVRAAKKADVQIMVDFHNRWNPPVFRIKRDLEGGEPGKVIHAYCRLSDTIYVPTEMLSWAAQSSILWFLGSHSLDTLTWLIGSKVKRVYAVSSEGILTARGVNVPDVYQATLEYENGAIAQMENGWIIPNANPHVNDYKLNLTCEHAAFSMDYSHHRLLERVYESRADRPDVICKPHVQGKAVGLAHESLRDFIDCVHHDKPVKVPLEDSVNVTRVLLAIMESAERRQPVEVEPVDLDTL